jgi:hypothetical protein
MSVTPPFESRIEVSTGRDGTVVLTLPTAKTGVMRFGIAAFLLFWIGGWAVGWITSFRQITSGRAEPFLIFWLCGWTVGGAFAFWYLWRLLRPAIPETLTVAKLDLAYDSGMQPFAVSFGYRAGNDYWKKMFQKRKRIRFTRDEVATLTLRDTSDSNRLTIDHGNERIDIGIGLTEVEREWLFRLLKAEYGV